MHLQSGGLKQVKTFDFLIDAELIFYYLQACHMSHEKKKNCKDVKVFKPVFPISFFLMSDLYFHNSYRELEAWEKFVIICDS